MPERIGSHLLVDVDDVVDPVVVRTRQRAPLAEAEQLLGQHTADLERAVRLPAWSKTATRGSIEKA